MSRSSKLVLRRLISRKLAELNPQQIRTQSLSIFEQICTNPEFNRANKVGLFMNMAHEVDTQEVLKYCFEKQKIVFLPRCIYSLEKLPSHAYMEMLMVNSMEEVLTLQPQGKFQLREPESGHSVMEEGELDVLVMPGVGFTLKGDRLGHGAGFYDRFLNQFYDRFGRKPYLIGLALTEQIVEQIPMEIHDWKLDIVITPKIIS